MSPKSVSLALQGGAARGAYTWGVLDRLLEDGRLRIEGVSGASSGAVNAALLAQGLAQGGAARARQILEAFWQRVPRVCVPRKRRLLSALQALLSRRGGEFQAASFHRLLGSLLLDFEVDPRTMEPLRGALAESIDFGVLGAAGGVKLFVNATDVQTNKIKVFAGSQVTLDALCASMCLPFFFDAVKVEGRSYWDGAYLGNPAIFPLIDGCATSDIVLVQTSPIAYPRPPRTAAELLARITEVSFTAGLVREMRAIAFITQLLSKGMIRPEAGLRSIRMHRIDAGEEWEGVLGANKFSAELPVLLRLRDHGRKAAEAWLRRCFEDVGRASTGNIEDLFV